MEATSVLNDVQKSQSNTPSFMDKMISGVFMVIISLTFLWNWDGFWQTNIPALKNVQQKHLPAKYNEEQLKISRSALSNDLLDQANARIHAAEQEAQRQTLLAGEANQKLMDVLAKESEKCRYYKTSLLVIKNLTRKFSEDELHDILRCSNEECEQIVTSSSAAKSICE